MGTIVRAVQLLALTVWVGGVVFFAFVVAPVAFGLLPSAQEAGLVVGGTLRVLHWMGLAAGAVCLLSEAAGARRRAARGRRWWLGTAVVAGMLALTVWSQFGILPRMERDRVEAGAVIDTAARGAGPSADFNRLHLLSEKVEGGVLLLGIAAVVLAARQQASPAAN